MEHPEGPTGDGARTLSPAVAREHFEGLAAWHGEV